MAWDIVLLPSFNRQTQVCACGSSLVSRTYLEEKAETTNPWGPLVLARATACWCCFAVVSLKDCLETGLEQFRG